MLCPSTMSVVSCLPCSLVLSALSVSVSVRLTDAPSPLLASIFIFIFIFILSPPSPLCTSSHLSSCLSPHPQHHRIKTSCLRCLFVFLLVLTFSSLCRSVITAIPPCRTPIATTLDDSHSDSDGVFVHTYMHTYMHTYAEIEISLFLPCLPSLESGGGLVRP